MTPASACSSLSNPGAPIIKELVGEGGDDEPQVGSHPFDAEGNLLPGEGGDDEPDLTDDPASIGP